MGSFKDNLSNYSHIPPNVDSEILKKVWEWNELIITEPIEFICSSTKAKISVCFLDLTSGMTTGTFKDIAAGYLTARCLTKTNESPNWIKEFITQSSWNTLNALSLLTSKYWIKTIGFYPKKNEYKLLDKKYLNGDVLRIQVDGDSSDVKKITQIYSETHWIPWLPTFDDQIFGNMIRADFIKNYSDFVSKDNSKFKFDFMIQALSSWYGVFGTYRRFSDIISKENIPSFIGVQTDWNNPYFKFHHGITQDSNPVENIEPTLFRTNLPSEFKEEMNSYIWDKWTMVSVSLEDRERYSTKAINILKDQWIECTESYNKLENKYEITEKAWILSVISFLKLLDQGFFTVDTNILLSITWGNAKWNRGELHPDCCI